MKYFHKLFFSILLILTLAVTAVESAAVSFSLENSFSREKTKALAQHQLVKYSIQAAVLSSAQDGGVTAAELPIIGEKAAALLGRPVAVQVQKGGAAPQQSGEFDKLLRFGAEHPDIVDIK